MNAQTDLLTVGEAYAEMDLVVRQLDDGSLTVAVDDSLPDDERVKLEATDDGLRASVVVAPAAECSEGLTKALESIGQSLGGGTITWSDGSVIRSTTIPWKDDFSQGQLRTLFEQVERDARKLGPDLTMIATGLKEWDESEDDDLPEDKDERARAMRRAGAGFGYEPQEPEARPDRPAVPPSFLPGSGQTGEGERATMRYGAAGDVPGTSELGADERGVSYRVERPVQPGGQTPFAVIGTLAALFFVALVGVFMKLTGEEEVAPTPTPTPPVATAPSDVDVDVDPDDDVDVIDDEVGPSFNVGARNPSLLGGDSSTTPRPRPTNSGSGGFDRPRPSSGLNTEKGVLKAVGGPDAEARRRAVEAWAEFKMDRAEGSRLRMLRALDKRIEPEVGMLLLKSFRERPVGVEEALECLQLSNEGIRRTLIEQLASGQHSADDAEVIAEMLAEIPDSEDMLIEMSLIRLGHPKPGAAQRMIQKRGVVWVQLGDGNELVSRMIARDLEQSKPLSKHDDEAVRALVCDFLAKTDDPKALAYVTPLLADRSIKVRRRAVECMANLRSAKASWPLARQLVAEKDTRTAEVIRAAISKLPAEETAKYLHALLKKKRVSDRLAAIQALRAMARGEAVPYLLKGLRDPTESIQLETLTALRKLHKQPLLAESVSQGLSEIRRVALSKNSGKKVKKAARQLHYQVTGRFPD